MHLHCTTTDTTYYSVVRALVGALPPRQWKVSSQSAWCDLPGLAVHTDSYCRPANSLKIQTSWQLIP